MATPKGIPEQVKLPLRVALGVVGQGIRIRLGRSIVTVTGVVLGIAFLMSILTTQAMKRAMTAEDALRESASRMYGALVSESGSLHGRGVALLVTARPSAEERRLVERLADEGAKDLRMLGDAAALPGVRRVQSPANLGRDAAALIVLGQATPPRDVVLAALATARQKLVAFGARRPGPTDFGAGIEVIELARPLAPDALAARAREAQRERFRGSWIIAISLIVTVIGISNAMLMSVTERFRDIGTMKCLGATSPFIRRLFLIEACFMGAVGGAAGVLLGAAFAVASYLVLYGPVLIGQALGQELAGVALAAGLSLLSGVVLSILAALYPAHFAAGMVPAAALRSNV